MDFHARFPLEGYRRLTFMMLDADIVACSPASVYRVLSFAGLLDRWNKKPSKKGTGFVQPLRPHQHWHVDISYLNLSGTFYYLCSVLDGASRVIVHFEVRERMTELDVECIPQRAREKYPGRTSADHHRQRAPIHRWGIQELIRMCGMTHVRTSVGYPQSNGKLERWHHSVKSGKRSPSQPNHRRGGDPNSGGLRITTICVRLRRRTILRPLDYMNVFCRSRKLSGPQPC